MKSSSAPKSFPVMHSSWERCQSEVDWFTEATRRSNHDRARESILMKQASSLLNPSMGASHGKLVRRGMVATADAADVAAGNIPARHDHVSDAVRFVTVAPQATGR